MADKSNRHETWAAVIAGALLMLATLPGRTQGLGLITEPLLADLNLSRHSYAQINLWATLLGALACVPVGAFLDRHGPRPAALILLPALAAVVWLMSGLHASASVVVPLFILVLLTRALGQSALSVVSIAAAGKAFKQGKGGAAAAYTVLLSVLYMAAFVVTGSVIRQSGWRAAWGGIAVGLIVMMPVAFLLRKLTAATAKEQDESASGVTLANAMTQPAFWIYSAGIALFAAVQAGVGLFNEALLAERGFDQKAYHHFLAGSALIALIGQVFGGVGTRWLPLRVWLGAALILQGMALAAFQFIGTAAGLWSLAAMMGISAGIITVAFFAIWGRALANATSAASWALRRPSACSPPPQGRCCWKVARACSAAMQRR